MKNIMKSALCMLLAMLMCFSFVGCGSEPATTTAAQVNRPNVTKPTEAPAPQAETTPPTEAPTDPPTEAATEAEA